MRRLFYFLAFATIALALTVGVQVALLSVLPFGAAVAVATILSFPLGALCGVLAMLMDK